MTDQQKAGKRGRDDSISIQPYPTYLYPIYLSTLRICKVGLYTELFYAIVSTLFPCFLLICYPYILLHF